MKSLPHLLQFEPVNRTEYAPITLFRVAVLALILASYCLCSDTTYALTQGPNGNFYEFVLAPGIPWPDAKAAADSRSFGGRAGHLATITSAEEDIFLDRLRIESVQFGQFWVGGSQLPSQGNPYDGWSWENNEGPIPGFNGGPIYANWFSGEPNDFYGPDTENYLTIGFFGGLGWNDEGAIGQVSGYVVEYESIPLLIDIKPGSDPNSVNLESNGRISVAVLSTPELAADEIDISTVRFGHDGSEAAPAHSAKQDADGDGDADLVLQFNMQDTGLQCDDTAGILTAKTRSGLPSRGSDSIRVVKCQPYELSIVALQDVNKLTDVLLKFRVVAAGYTAPTTADHINLKSYDILGKLRWTKNLHDQSLSLGPENCSLLNLQFSDMARYQPVKAQVQVPDGQRKNTQVLRDETAVLFRPDLAIENVSAPTTVNVRQIVNIIAYLRELNGDLGAVFDIYLMEKGKVIDVAKAVSIGPHGEAKVVFSTIFTEVGTQELDVVITNTAPGDYDPSNNQRRMAIEVLQPPLEPVSYFASYQRDEFESFTVFDNPFVHQEETRSGRDEFLSETLFVPFPLNFPIGRVAIDISADGSLRETYEAHLLEETGSFSFDCFISHDSFRDLGNGVLFYIQSVRQPCLGEDAGQTYVNFHRFALDTVFFSIVHDKVWGTTSEFGGPIQLGTFLNATESVSTRFIIESSAGSFGGGAFVPLTSAPFEDIYDFVGPDFSFRGYKRGTRTSGFNSGITTP